MRLLLLSLGIGDGGGLELKFGRLCEGMGFDGSERRNGQCNDFLVRGLWWRRREGLI